MKFIEEIEKSVAESIEMDKKSTFSGRLYGGIGLGCNISAFLLAAICEICFLSSPNRGVSVWLWTLYPILVFVALGLFFSIKQRLRGRFMSANLSIILGVVCLLITVALIIVQVSVFKKVFIYPFVI